MYNRDIKERFLRSDMAPSQTNRSVLWIFDDLGDEERKVEKDIAEMDRDMVVSVINRLKIGEYETARQLIDTAKMYTKWCLREQVFGNIKAGFLLVNADDIDASGFLKEYCFTSESMVFREIDKVGGFSTGDPAPMVLWFSWLGLLREEIYGLLESEIDMDDRVISRNGVEIVRGFSDLSHEVFETYSNTDKVMRPFGMREIEVYRDNSSPWFLKKYITPNSSKESGYDNRQLDASIGRLNKRYVMAGGIPRMTFSNVWRSGRLLELHEREASGLDVFDSSNKQIVNEVFRKKKQYPAIIWQYKNYKKAFNL